MITPVSEYRKGSTEEAIKNAIGGKISGIEFDEDYLTICIDGNYELTIADEGQQCCENRYMTTDDDLSYYVGSIFMDANVSEETSDDYDHDAQFLTITTSKGTFTIETHNEHNGYYGGFDIRASGEHKESK